MLATTAQLWTDAPACFLYSRSLARTITSRRIVQNMKDTFEVQQLALYRALPATTACCHRLLQVQQHSLLSLRLLRNHVQPRRQYDGQLKHT
jgi:hypothetical protein